jgi:hypothetical protein
MSRNLPSTAFKPGERPVGRAKGTPNKITQDVQEKLAALGCDPIMGMARIALDEENSIELRAKMLAELANYVLPKRKAVEHSGEIRASLLEILIAAKVG